MEHDGNDPTEIPGQAVWSRIPPYPVSDANASARTARLARGTRPLSDAERMCYRKVLLYSGWSSPASRERVTDG